MVSPLISALLGAGEQYMADEDASDQLKGDIIDAASKKYFDVELPQQKGVINAMKEVKRAIANEYGDKVADIGDNYGYFEDGNLDQYILNAIGAEGMAVCDDGDKTLSETEKNAFIKAAIDSEDLAFDLNVYPLNLISICLIFPHYNHWLDLLLNQRMILQCFYFLHLYLEKQS